VCVRMMVKRETMQEIAVVEKNCQRIEQVGLTLAEAKTLLQAAQQCMVERQTAAFWPRTHCQACGTPLRTKGHPALTFRTLFGTITLTSPRVHRCSCTSHPTATDSPLIELLPERTAPELLFMETKWASLVSYGLTAQALKDFLPVDARLNDQTVQNHTTVLPAGLLLLARRLCQSRR
jgi:hypothetical protein